MTKGISKIYSIVILVFVFCIISTAEIIKEVNQENKSIYLDPGHGGKDCGAISKDDFYEKELNLNICFYLKTYLENADFKVYLTRDGDYDLASPNAKIRKTEDITKRVNLINNSNCLLYISVHANIYSSGSIKGAQTFYKANDEKCKLLAENVQEQLISILKNTNRKALAIKGKYLIDNTVKPGSLVEVGFLSNDEELSLLKTESYQKQIAYAIFQGIINYL